MSSNKLIKIKFVVQNITKEVTEEVYKIYKRVWGSGVIILDGDVPSKENMNDEFFLVQTKESDPSVKVEETKEVAEVVEVKPDKTKAKSTKQTKPKK